MMLENMFFHVHFSTFIIGDLIFFRGKIVCKGMSCEHFDNCSRSMSLMGEAKSQPQSPVNWELYPVSYSILHTMEYGDMHS